MHHITICICLSSSSTCFTGTHPSWVNSWQPALWYWLSRITNAHWGQVTHKPQTAEFDFCSLWSFHFINGLLLHSLSFSLQGQRSGGGEGTGVSVLNGEPGDSLPELGIKLLPCGERRRHRRVTQTLINEHILLWKEKLSWNNYKLLDMHEHMLGISIIVKDPLHTWIKAYKMFFNVCLRWFLQKISIITTLKSLK